MYTLKTYWNLLEKVPPRELRLSKYESEQPLASFSLDLTLALPRQV